MAVRRSCTTLALATGLTGPVVADAQHAESDPIVQDDAVTAHAARMPTELQLPSPRILPSATSTPTMQMSTSISTALASTQPVATMEVAPVPIATDGNANNVASLMSSGAAPTSTPEPILRLGPGDAVTVQVFGRPEFNTTAYVSEDQTILVPLAGPVKVGGLSPADAAMRVGDALRDGQYLVNPQVSINISQFRSQQISVLGEVHTPGRYSIESRTSVLDMLAQAGGVNETGADVITLIRTGTDGQVEHLPINLKKLVSGDPSQSQVALRGGDSLFIPRAEQYYVYGEVTSPNMYRLEAGMTVVQAISRSGGLTPRGSDRRIEIKRLTRDGEYRTLDASLSDSVQPNDVIRVKERIF